jgi:hypothetical protein
MLSLSHLEQCIPEIQEVIFFLACSDGGKAGATLALVSKTIAAQSKPFRFNFVSITGETSLSNFERAMERVGAENGKVQHLFIADKRVLPGPSHVPKPMTNFMGFVDNDEYHDWGSELCDSDSRENDNALLILNSSETNWLKASFFDTLERVLGRICSHLKTLTVVCTYCRATLRAITAHDFPLLETFKVSDQPPSGLQFSAIPAWTRSKLDRPLRMPRLHTFTMKVRSSPLISDSWMFIHRIISSCNRLDKIVMDGFTIDADLPNVTRHLLGKPVSQVKIPKFLSWIHPCRFWYTGYPNPRFLRSVATVELAASFMSFRTDGINRLAVPYVHWAFEIIKTMRADGAVVKSPTSNNGKPAQEEKAIWLQEVHQIACETVL